MRWPFHGQEIKFMNHSYWLITPIFSQLHPATTFIARTFGPQATKQHFLTWPPVSVVNKSRPFKSWQKITILAGQHTGLFNPETSAKQLAVVQAHKGALKGCAGCRVEGIFPSLRQLLPSPAPLSLSHSLALLSGAELERICWTLILTNITSCDQKHSPPVWMGWKSKWEIYSRLFKSPWLFQAWRLLISLGQRRPSPFHQSFRDFPCIRVESTWGPGGCHKTKIGGSYRKMSAKKKSSNRTNEEDVSHIVCDPGC